jgi:hypothetical protein
MGEESLKENRSVGLKENETVGSEPLKEGGERDGSYASFITAPKDPSGENIVPLAGILVVSLFKRR